jgi:hypothetical protein
MMRPSLARVVGCATVAVVCFALETTSAATINFGANRNGLHGAPAGVATSADWRMSLAA